MSAKRKLIAGVLTLSDSRSEAEDESGKAIKEILAREGFETVEYAVIPDNKVMIKETLVVWANERLDLIVTTGGTGPGPRDVTPEATESVLERNMPGLSELIRMEGLKKTKRACLSRGVSGIRGKTIIINLPGSKKGAVESLEAVIDQIPHALLMMEGGGH
ncbi:MAG: MogA/MoaB family molybdenum cofactor biosynthesis protein [Deltaproteobacteria bacterium]|nr:MogA/MoaB family molybdenum cofactor biosynthesis protein [Deltaproteobacteria bacterium]